MKKRVIWVIVLALISAYGLLSWVQYQYYDRILTLRKENMRSQMKDALSEVAEELQVRELVRYLNKGVGSKDAPLSSPEFVASDVAPFDIWPRTKTDTLTVRQAIDADQVVLRLPNKGKTNRIDYRPSEMLLHAYFVNLHALDKYLLKYIYDTSMNESVEQLVNVRLLKNLIRERLDSKNLCVAYQMTLYDYQGNVLYEYRPPGVMRGDWEEDENSITQHLFVPTDGSTEGRPYMRVSLDLDPTRAEVLRLALPSFISTIIVLLLGFSALGVLLKYFSFSSQRTNFINNMTHELKTPISSIVLSTKLLEESTVPASTSPKQRQMVSVISMEAQRLKFLIDKVLQLSILEGHTGKFSLETLDVNELILPVAEIYTFHAQQREGDLILDLEATNTWVRGNQMHLSNVFFNLLDNAVKYSNPDRPLRLRVSTQDDGDYILITIEDNGIGMERMELRRIFDRFYRISSGKRHDVRGFGLGLAYVYSVIRQSKGKITAESDIGVGTKMTIRLPVYHDV